ncbi:phospholipase A2-like [Aplochiton taeniatus]
MELLLKGIAEINREIDSDITVHITKEHSKPRQKRGLKELAGVIRCSTGRSPAGYVMYGCYCGLGGRGWPKDKADWCCHKHDCCYGRLDEMGCQTRGNYNWACENKESRCDSVLNRCEKLLCKCDTDLASCLSNAPYNPKYALWPDFLCGRKCPTCANP